MGRRLRGSGRPGLGTQLHSILLEGWEGSDPATAGLRNQVSFWIEIRSILDFPRSYFCVGLLGISCQFLNYLINFEFGQLVS